MLQIKDFSNVFSGCIPLEGVEIEEEGGRI